MARRVDTRHMDRRPSPARRSAEYRRELAKSSARPRAAAVDPESPISADDLAKAEQRPKLENPERRWLPDDAPLAHKGLLLGLAALSLGLGIGLSVTALALSPIATMLVLLVAASVLVCLWQWWVVYPVQRLIQRLELLARTRQPMQLKDLPVHRRDELGRIARAMHRLALDMIRCDYDSRQLRRTMDSRIREEAKRMNHKLERMAHRDALTDLANRRFMDEHLPELFNAAQSAKDEDLVCVMLDMDNFKAVNDTLGHHAGDELLVLLAGLLSGHIRSDDLAVRLGGDEFCVLMPGAELERAVDMVAKVRRLFRQQNRTMHPQGPFANLSAGVSALRTHHAVDGPDLVAHADKLLYAAKQGGKGKTCTSTHCSA